MNTEILSNEHGQKVEGDLSPAALIRPDVVINGYSGFARIHRLMAEAVEKAGLCRYLGFADYGVIPLPEDLEKCFRVPDLASLINKLTKPSLVMSPSPIHHHGSDHERIVKAGHACYLEKPPTLDPVELEAMRSREHRAAFPTAIGFQQSMPTLCREIIRKRANPISGQIR